MVTSITMPFECETFANPEKPLLGLYIDVDMTQLNDLIGRMGLQMEIGNGIPKSLPRAIGPAVMDEDMVDATNRLTRAKDLIVQENMKAYIAADQVGYESPSQLSREFKRYFGQSPAEMIRELRAL